MLTINNSSSIRLLFRAIHFSCHAAVTFHHLLHSRAHTLPHTIYHSFESVCMPLYMNDVVCSRPICVAHAMETNTMFMNTTTNFWFTSFCCVEWINDFMFFRRFRRHIYSKSDWIVKRWATIIDVCRTRRPHTPITYVLLRDGSSWLWIVTLPFLDGGRSAALRPNASVESELICILNGMNEHESSNELVNCGFDSMEMGNDCHATFVIIYFVIRRKWDRYKICVNAFIRCILFASRMRATVALVMMAHSNCY